MANSKELRTRIKGVSSTRKITRTMQLVATAKAKGAQDRVQAVVPYGRTLLSMVSRLVAAGAKHPLLAGGHPPRPAGEAERVVLFGISANRGLCGGYNANVVKMVTQSLAEAKAAGAETTLHMSGKKGLSTLKFLGVTPDHRYTQFEDKPSFEEVAEVAAPILAAFTAGEIDRLDVISYRFISAGNQVAQRHTLLPITPPALDDDAATAIEPLLHPDPHSLLGELLPLVAQTSLFQAFVEAAVSEQIQRRIAMKNATDAADDMTRDLKMEYNRARQAAITQEIAEIVGGAAALQ
jgi:F-type H+-transporting ATPase subunit gamma